MMVWPQLLSRGIERSRTRLTGLNILAGAETTGLCRWEGGRVQTEVLHRRAGRCCLCPFRV